jgi:aspartate/methionine/tyrosine aminotransferase
MTGWRAGWIVAPPSFIQHADNLAACMLYGLPGFVQEAAIQALAIADTAEAEVREYCRRRRALFHDALQGIPGIRPCMPEAGMFMLIDVRATGLGADAFVHGLFKAEGVSLLDGAVFGRETEGFVRACFAADEATLVDAAARIRRYCERLVPAR